MSGKPINKDIYKRNYYLKKTDIYKTGFGPIKMQNYSKPKKTLLNLQEQIISQKLNKIIENNNNNNNPNLNYQNGYSGIYEKQKEQKMPSNSIRPQSYIGKNNKNHNTFDYSNINGKRIPVNKTSIDAQKREPENSYNQSNPRIDMKMRSPEGIPLNSYMHNKDINNLSKETKTKPLNSKNQFKRGYSSGYSGAKKTPQDHKDLKVKNFDVETPKKNEFQKETNSSIKKESSSKFGSSSKRGRTDKNFHPKDKIKKKKLDLNHKAIKEEEQVPNAQPKYIFRGKQNLKVINKPISPIEEGIEAFKGEIGDDNEVNILKNEITELKKQLKKFDEEKLDNQKEIRDFQISIKLKDNEIGLLKKNLETQKKFTESLKSSFNNQSSKLNQLEEKIKELQGKNDEKDNEIEQLKENIEKLKKLNKEDNEKTELIKNLRMKEKLISKKDSEISELKSQLDNALILNEKMKLDKQKMKTNNINNEDMQKELKKKEKEIELNLKNLKEREKQVIKKEKEINERILFIEDVERALESKQNKLDSEKKFMTDNYQNLQKEIGNLNNQKMQLENQIHAMDQQIKSFNPNPFNNNMNPNFMNMNNNMNIQNNMNNIRKFNSVNTDMVLNRMNNNMAFNSNYNIINMNNMMNNNMMQNMNMNNNMIANNNMNMNNFNNNMNNNNIQINNNKRNNNNNINPPKASKPLTFYKGPTLIGLQNIGATCFMNATLQCLSQTEDLTNYFLDEKRSAQKVKNNNIAKKNRNDLQLTPVYLELVKNLWDKNNSKGYVEPKKFMKTVEEMNPLFKLGQPGDSKDFIIFVLEQFHNELKKENKNNNDDDYSVNQYDKNNAFNYFLEDFSKQTSIISDIFYGIIETNNICLYCKNKYESQGKPYPICYNYQVFNCLIFPLEEVRKMKNGNIRMNNINMSNNNEVTLQDCFIYNQKTDHFTGENKNHCNICKQLWDSLYTSRIYSGPNVLVLILNRGKNNIYNVKLNFTETIDITQFVLAKIERMVYKLVGVITHYGQSGPNAHFMAFCKSPIDNKWYRYNDAIVTEVKNLQRDVIDFGTPYILFYRKEN